VTAYGKRESPRKKLSFMHALGRIGQTKLRIPRLGAIWVAQASLGIQRDV